MRKCVSASSPGTRPPAIDCYCWLPPGTHGYPAFSLAFRNPLGFWVVPEVAGLVRTRKVLAPSAALPAEPAVDMHNGDGDSRVIARMSVTDCGESGKWSTPAERTSQAS
ncbi:hypothetical protein GCM10009687_81060 [Asanoa iriomotensis]|uniref:Uncharacterized protein n=1 Tax=Asanoa iriomotensis TaxID=234613 RepID=A0ABQ4CFE8_9ACTN|nr:hypothetical protein Air01nite_75960 [Asanoa iriomotensis]